MFGEITHGHGRRGNEHPMYTLWRAIKQRCTNSRNRSYKYYGGAGVEIWEPWRTDYVAFYNDVLREIGERPSPAHSFCMINAERGYCPGNLIWRTASPRMRASRAPLPAACEKRRLALAGQPKSDEARAKMSAAWTHERRAAQAARTAEINTPERRAALAAWSRSPEIVAKRNASNTGKKHSPERVANMRAGLLAHYAAKRSATQAAQ